MYNDVVKRINNENNILFFKVKRTTGSRVYLAQTPPTPPPSTTPHQPLAHRRGRGPRKSAVTVPRQRAPLAYILLL